MVSSGRDGLDAVKDSELREQLRAALATLPDRAAEVFILRHFEDRKNPEIARMLGITQIGVAVTLHRARKKLQEELRKAGVRVMNNRDFDSLFDKTVDSIRKDVPNSDEAAERVRRRISEDHDATSLCATFRGPLTEERKMLLRDHMGHLRGLPSRASGSSIERRRDAEACRSWSLGDGRGRGGAGRGCALGVPVSVGPRACSERCARDGRFDFRNAGRCVRPGCESLAVGAEVGEGQEIRTGKESRAVVLLTRWLFG